MSFHFSSIILLGLVLVTIRHQEVTVYPDEDNKPPVGQGLNRSARITLFDIYPIDRTTHEEITDVDRIKMINYEEYLKELTKKFDGEFVSYDANDGAWVFMVRENDRKIEIIQLDFFSFLLG